MDRQYLWLVLVFTVALLTILALQANYTIDNYRLQATEFEQEVDQIFAKAVEEEKQIRKDTVLAWFRRTLADTNQIILSVNYDAEDQMLLNHIRDKGETSPYTSISFSEDQRKITELDSANRQITIDLIVNSTANYLEKHSIYYWTPKLGEQFINKTKSLPLNQVLLDSIFQFQLQAERIRSPHQIISIPFDSTTAWSSDSRMVQTDAYFTDLNTQETKVYARFTNPFSAIIRRIWLSVFSSIAIILLTTGGFLIMLRIILRQKQLAQIKDDFIDNMTHELQTPIATLMAANESMEKYNLLKDQEKAEKYLKISRLQIQRLAQMVDRTLLNSFYHRKELNINPTLIQIHPLIQESLSSFRIRKPKVDISFAPDPEITEVRIDPVHFKNILENLVENALKHNADQPDLAIQIKTGLQNDQQFILEVQDNGKGIPQKQHKMIFDKFYRVDDTQANGFGIGLYYVHQVVEAMNGSIQLNSISGQGCHFRIEIPIR